jgi:tRNA (guanine-N7-)-methyltransferase
MTTPPDHPLLRSYGRLKSRPIKPRQAALVETLLPTLRCPQAPFDPAALAPGCAETWLEIGFGGGEHMAAQAARRPEVLILGAEPFQNGVASAVRHIDEQGLRNVRIEDGDARALSARLPDASIARIFVLFPDPWPKARHHKRRLIQPDFVAGLLSRLAPGGYLHCATDWQPYAEQMLAVLSAEPGLTNSAPGYAPKPDWRPLTKFEHRGLKLGHGVWDLLFTRR